MVGQNFRLLMGLPLKHSAEGSYSGTPKMRHLGNQLAIRPALAEYRRPCHMKYSGTCSS